MQNFITCNLNKTQIKLHSCLQALWYKKNLFCYALLPLSLIYKAIIFFHSLIYKIGLKKVRHFDVPIIVIGNITTGGTGKTPLVIFLAKLLLEHGYKPGVISRGYIPFSCFKRKERAITHLVKESDDPSIVGDEALLIAKNTGCNVAVSKSRVLAVEELLKTGCDVIISDDGLQHHALGRDIEIAVVDGVRQFGNGFLLPAGPLRESKKRLGSIDFIIFNSPTKTRHSHEPCHPHVYKDRCIIGTQTYHMHFKPTHFYNIQNPSLIKPVDSFASETVHAVSGIGNPQNFFNLLRSIKINVIEHPFPDHHKFTREDIDFKDETTIIMTEKDAVKCSQFANDRCFVLKIDIDIDGNFSTVILAKARIQVHHGM